MHFHVIKQYTYNTSQQLSVKRALMAAGNFEMKFRNFDKKDSLNKICKNFNKKKRKKERMNERSKKNIQKEI